MPDCYRPPAIVRCGWCPCHLANDDLVIRLHFAEDHGVLNGSNSIRYNVAGDDWDVGELLGAAASPKE